MKFLLYITILGIVAESPRGLTAGQVTKKVVKQGRGVTKAQVSAAMKSMMLDGLLSVRQEAYRPGLDKKVFTMTEHCAILLSSIARDYMENEKQMVMFSEVENG